jgi:DNA segregation ATPase FtsK/SpoIIIE-like protein
MLSGSCCPKGRAVGISVVGAIQDPRKEVLPARDLFPIRVAFRLADADQVRLVFSPGAQLYELIRSGRLRTVKCGRRRLVPV